MPSNHSKRSPYRTADPGIDWIRHATISMNVSEALDRHHRSITQRADRRSNRGEFVVASSYNQVEPAMKWTIPIALLCGDVGLRRAASPQSPQTSDCRYVLSLNLALATASEAIRLRVEDGYRVTATVVGMAAAPQVALRGDGATVNTRESSFQKTFTVVTLGPMFNFDTSGEFFNLVKANPYAPRLATVSDVMALPGAVAFKSKKAIVAARGVGGVRGGGGRRRRSAHREGREKRHPAFT